MTEDAPGGEDAGEIPVAPDSYERSLRNAFDHAPIGMALTSPQGVVTRCNGALGALLGRSPDDLLGRTLFEVTHVEDLSVAREHCTYMQSGGHRVIRHECRFLRPDGQVVWVLVSTSRVPAAADSTTTSALWPAHLVMHIEDITDRKALETQLVHQASHDSLTGLANRALLLETLTHALARATRTGRPLSVLYLDLDGFKGVNDAHGHHAGDAVLRQFADRLQTSLRTSDLVARMGGDEFAVLCEDTDPAQAQAAAERIHSTLHEPFVVEDSHALAPANASLRARLGDESGHVPHGLTLGVAVGVVTISTDQSPCSPPTDRAHEPDRAPQVDATTVLVSADQAMYRAKHAGSHVRE